MKKKLQVSTLLKKSVRKVAVIAVCLLSLTQFTYSQDYDLALINGISSAFGPDFCPGDIVRVNAAVYNVGDIEACNVEITAYIPDGMTLNEDPLNSIWELDGSVATTIIPDCIPPGGQHPSSGSLQLSLIQTIDADFSGETINFYTEISADDGDDIDSTPDQDPDNDEGAEPNTDTDNSINNSDDEDDHDVAQITLNNCATAGCTDPCAPNYDSDATSDDGSCDDYDGEESCNDDICDGDLEEWDEDECDCEVTEEQVVGCTDDDATNYNPDANCNEGCEYEVGGCTDPCAPNYDADAEEDDGSCEDYDGEESCNDDICDGDVEEWNDDECECEVTEERVRGCTDEDATNYDPDANCDRGCEYDEGEYDLSLIMGISSSFGTTYCPGDEVRFNAAIYNQGELEACDVDVSFHIPDGMSLSDHPVNDKWSEDGSVVTTTIASCISPGGVYPNDSRNPLSIRLEIDEDFDGSSISSYAEISSDDGSDIDSTPDDDPDNDAGADPSTGTDNTIHGQRGDEDDHDVQVISVDDCGLNVATSRLGKVESVSALTIDRLFPTITSANLNMVVDASDKVSTTVQIVDFEGKVLLNEVYQLKESLNSLNFDVSELPDGMYFINTITGDQLVTNKFVKK